MGKIKTLTKKRLALIKDAKIALGKLLQAKLKILSAKEKMLIARGKYKKLYAFFLEEKYEYNKSK